MAPDLSERFVMACQQCGTRRLILTTAEADDWLRAEFAPKIEALLRGEAPAPEGGPDDA